MRHVVETKLMIDTADAARDKLRRFAYQLLRMRYKPMTCLRIIYSPDLPARIARATYDIEDVRRSS